MIRAGKASLEADLAPIFERLNLDRHALEATMAKLFQPSERVPNQIGRLARPLGDTWHQLDKAIPQRRGISRS